VWTEFVWLLRTQYRSFEFHKTWRSFCYHRLSLVHLSEDVTIRTGGGGGIGVRTAVSVA
jgi:hypothetical protein